MLLAAVGTYGVLSYMVSVRRREIGIRMALGAGRSQVLAQVMKEGLQFATIGVLSGSVARLAWAGSLHRCCLAWNRRTQRQSPR